LVRRFPTLLFVIALTLRSLVPVGFMLAPVAADGAMTVVICTGHGPQIMTLDAEGNPVPQKSGITDQNVCPYAASAPLAVGVTAPAPEMVPASFADPLYPSDYVSDATRRWISSTLVHGPPALQV
jgi:hypothetical protein